MWARPAPASLSRLHRSFQIVITENVDDWLRYIKSTEGTLGDELELSELQPGDVLRVVTRNADYVLTISKGREAILKCSEPGRPEGPVQIRGCTFGGSSSIKPDHLFCGGNLELGYRLDGASMVHRTTAIKEILLRRRRP
jgi:hypothetical protein